MKKNGFRQVARLTLAVLVAVVLLCLSLGQNLIVHAASGPTITLSANTIKAGHGVKLIGRGFATNEYLTIQLSAHPGVTIAWIGCNASGYCAGTVEVPNTNIREGTYTLTATGTVSNHKAHASLRIIPGVSLQIQNGNPDSHPSGGPRTPLTLSGAGFLAKEKVTVRWGSITGTIEGAPTSDVQGNLNFTFSAPKKVAPGSYKIFVVRTHEPISTSTTFTIVKPKAFVPTELFGTSFFLSYVGFRSGETVEAFLQINGAQTLIYTGVAGPDGGSDSVQMAQIPLLPHNNYPLVFVGETSSITLRYTLAIVPGIVLEQQNAVNAGSTINIDGYGFSANETVQVFLQTASNGVITATTDATGNFTAALTLPDTIDIQTTYYVYAVNSANNESANLRVPFEGPNFEAPYPVYYGEATQVSGYGFASNERIDLYWNYQQPGQVLLGSVVADSYGSFNQTITVPSDPNTSSGQVMVAAVGESSGFVVTSTTSETMAFYLNPTVGAPGSQVQLTGGGFAAGETVSITFNGVVVASATADATGAIITTFAVPTLSPDYYPIVVTGATSQVTGNNVFKVLGN